MELVALNVWYCVQIEDNKVCVRGSCPKKIQIICPHKIFPKNDCFLQQCAPNRFVELQYGISFVENVFFCLEIEDNEVYVVQASP